MVLSGLREDAERPLALPNVSAALCGRLAKLAYAAVRKHLPVRDTAAAGGWACTETLVCCCEQPDDATMLAVVMGGAQLREQKAQ